KLAAQGYSDNIAEFQGQTLKLVNVGSGADTTYYKRDADGNYTIPIDVKGKIVIAQRGNLSIANIVNTAKKHGAKAVFLYNTVGDTLQDVFLGNTYGYLPTFLLNNKQGTAITSKLLLTEAMKGTSIDFTFGNMSQSVTTGNLLADFSSRGPSRVLYDIKP